MDALDAIKTRRSHRKFADQTVKRSLIEQVVECCRFAPSWKNTQTVRYHIIEDKDLLDNISKNCVRNFAFNGKTISRCAALVVVSSVANISRPDSRETSSSDLELHWPFFDAGIASQTFCLAAHALGLVSVILGIFDGEKIKTLCSLPQDQSVMALIAIVYPIETEKTPPKRLEVDEILTFIK